MPVLTDATREVERHDSTPSTTADLLFDAFFGGGAGGSAIALFLLGIDAIMGRVLFSPSVIGTALFTGEAVSATTPVRLDMVAYYSIVHFAVFGLLATIMSLLIRGMPKLDLHPLVIAVIVFGALTAGIFVADQFVLHGAVAAIGIGPVLGANAVTGLAMAGFFRWSHSYMR